MGRIVLIAAIALGLSAPALAFHCPADIARIDEALAAGTSLSAEQVAEVQALRDEGASLHAAGNHQQSVDTLARAMAILGIQ